MTDQEREDIARAARLRLLNQTPERITLSSVEDVDLWTNGLRPACTECDGRASWSTVVHSWIHLSPAFVDGEWIHWPPEPHNVVGPEWRPR